MRDFTVQKYQELLAAITAQPIPVYGIRRWLAETPAAGILMRHDVDRKPQNALAIAELEHAMGVAATYYFRITPNAFQPQIIERIAALGHEIGYHYEDLSLAQGDYAKARQLFQDHLALLRELAPITTIAMHGRPLSPYDNRDLWQQYAFTDFGITAEAFLTVDYANVYYITDTGRTWAETKLNLRDQASNCLFAAVASTDELIAFVTQHPRAKIAIIMHPERWNSSAISWFSQWGKDQAANTIKYLLYLRRRRKP